MIRFVENKLDVDTYLRLRESVHWKKLSREQAKMAIENSRHIVVAYEEDTPIGMGRIVGDGAVISYIQDLIIVPQAQGNGFGGRLLEQLIAYVDSITIEGTEMMLCLMCAKGRENFYQHHHFIARPTEALGPGMIQYIRRSC